MINSDPLGNIEFSGHSLVNSNISVNSNIFCPKQRLDDTAITAEAKYAINFTESGQIFVLSQHYNGIKSSLIVNATKIYQIKAKDSEIKPCSLLIVDYNGIVTNEILDIRI